MGDGWLTPRKRHLRYLNDRLHNTVQRLEKNERNYKSTSRKERRLHAKAEAEVAKLQEEVKMYKRTIRKSRRRLIPGDPAPCRDRHDRQAVKLYLALSSGLRILPRMTRLRVTRKFTSSSKLKSSRLTTRLSKDLRLDRRSLLQGGRRRKVSDQQRAYYEQRDDIINFLSEPEHSYTLPGKRDSVRVGNKRYQKVILTEFLSVLRDLYIKRYPSRKGKCSQSFFNGVRKEARWILPVRYNNTQICLCMKHQNFTLRLRAALGATGGGGRGPTSHGRRERTDAPLSTAGPLAPQIRCG